MPGLKNWLRLKVNQKGAFCSLDFSEFKPLAKKEAVEYNVEQITKKYDNLYVSLSGGIDSEFVAQSLHKHGVKFKPVIVDFELNAAEVWYAYRWCYENKISPEIIKLSYDVLMNKLPAVAVHFNTAYIQSMDFFIEKYVSERNGHVLTGTAEPFERIPIFEDKLNENLSTHLDINIYDYNLDLEFGDKHPSSFMTYTPEFFYSLIRDMDYNKPVQLAMSEYYGVNPRPKFDQAFNISMNTDISNLSKNVNSYNKLYNFYIGQKDDVLKKALNKERVSCITRLNSKQIFEGD